MNYSSIPSQTPSKYQVSHTSADSHSPEIDPLDWESSMAKLVGLEEENLTAEVQEVEDLASLPPLSKEAEEIQSSHSLSSNPFAKLGLVGTATLAIVLIAGVFLSQIMNTSNQKPSQNIVSEERRRSPPKTESSVQDLEAQVETLKTKLALAEQAEAIKTAQQNLKNKKPKPTPQPAIQPASQPELPVESRGQENVAPEVVTVERIVEVPPTPEQTTPDPFSEWRKLAKLGSYGQVEAIVLPTVNAAISEPVEDTDVKLQAQNSTSALPPSSASPLVSQEQPQNSLSVAIGSSAKAVLATAVFGETNNQLIEKEKGKSVFVVRLTEPIKAVNGEIALPANTELLAEISSLSEQGLLKLNVVTSILPDNGNLIEKSLPQNALAIRAAEGKPLMANEFSNQDSYTTSTDVELFVLGGLGRAAELLNRTDSEVVTTTTTGTIISNDNPKENIWAGVLEGGMQTIVPQITQRNQQEISQMLMQESEVWFLPAGTEVEVYVNQSIQF